MITLEKCYQDIAQFTENWSYYENPNLQIQDSWDSADSAYSFILRYFAFGGKSEVFKEEYLDQNKDIIKVRAPHIISTYLLGLKIAECFRIETKIRDGNNMNFLYYWFVSCLYHDVGYAFENEYNCEQLRTIREEGIEGLQEILNLQYVHRRIFQTYPEEIIDFYLRCRADCRKSKPVIDHGIAGGLLLYDKLRKQFARAWKQRTLKTDNRKSFFVMNGYGGRKLHFSTKHFEAYSKAADAIVTHNIWQSTLQDYIRDYGAADKLPKIKHNGISLKNELCFILSLADSIEPMKRGKHYLNKVSISEIDNKRGFIIKTDKNTYKELYSNIKSLKDWICIAVDVFEDNDKMVIEITA